MAQEPERLQIGMNARLFRSNWRPALDEVAFAGAHAMRCLQFHGEERGLGAERLGAAVTEVAAALEQAGVRAVMEIVAPLDAAGHTPAGLTPLELLEVNLPAISGLRCQCVHLHMFCVAGVEDAAILPLEEWVAPQLATGVALGWQHGFRFGFEQNQPGLRLLASPERCALLLASVPDLGLVWDFNHTAPEQLAGYLALASRMSMLHVSDTPLPTLNAHYPLGMGNIPTADYCRALLHGGFSGPAVLEIGGLPQSGGLGRDTDAALVESAQLLRAALDEKEGG